MPHALLSLQIHSRMLESVLRTKMIFFTQTRAGSIVQRFGKDLVSVSCSIQTHARTTSWSHPT